MKLVFLALSLCLSSQSRFCSICEFLPDNFLDELEELREEILLSEVPAEVRAVDGLISLYKRWKCTSIFKDRLLLLQRRVCEKLNDSSPEQKKAVDLLDGLVSQVQSVEEHEGPNAAEDVPEVFEMNFFEAS